MTILAGFVVAAAWAAAHPQAAPLPNEWDQPHGNPAGTAFVDVAPLKVPPTERWHAKYEQILAGPVVSQGKVYAVIREGKARKLVALEAESGAPLGKKTLECTGDVLGLAVVERLAAVVDPQNVRTYRFVGDSFRNEKTFAGGFDGEPTMVRDLVLVAGGRARGLVALDNASGKSEVVDDVGAGRAVVVTNRGEDQLLHLSLGQDGASFAICASNYLIVRGTNRARHEYAPHAFALTGGAKLAASFTLCSVASADAELVCFWLGGSANSGISLSSKAFPMPFVSPPAAREGRLYGYLENGQLIFDEVEQLKYLPLIEKAELPKGAKPGAPSIARDVLYLGNWAVEIGSRRVLWCLDALDPAGPIVPSGDEAFVATTTDGTLIGYGNGAAPAKRDPKATAASGGAKTKTAAAAAPAPTMPGAKPGVVRADGVYVVGSVTALDGGRFRLDTGSGAPQEFDAGALAWAATTPDAKVLNDQYPVYRACYAALCAQYVEVLLAQFQQWKKLEFLDDCRRLLDEAKRYGLAPVRADELVATISGRKSTTAGNADVQRKHLVEVEAAARAAFAENVGAAARWCADHGAPTAATALRLREPDMIPGRTIDPSALADWAPPDFPVTGSKTEIGKAWAEWADALLPSGAHFVKPDAALSKRLAKTPFSSGTKILATDHVLLISLEFDPKIIGPCLARAEATVRTLTRMLGKSPSGAKPDKTLEVRLYVTRQDYLADKSGGFAPPEWSAGVYSPHEAVSRFYSRLAADAEDPFGRSLHGVLAHELTHHFVDRVWNPASNPSLVPGFWMVEGFAEYVGEQAVEMDRLGGALDDSTVRSLDLTAAALKSGHFIPLAVLLDLDQARFGKELEGARFGPLQLRHTLFRCSLDPRGLFYVESAALTYFVMNRCGENGRATYIDWFACLCRAQTVPEMWKQVGFASLADFEEAFKKFLQGL